MAKHERLVEVLRLAALVARPDPTALAVVVETPMPSGKGSLLVAKVDMATEGAAGAARKYWGYLTNECRTGVGCGTMGEVETRIRLSGSGM